jgi:hypothetical protein
LLRVTQMSDPEETTKEQPGVRRRKGGPDAAFDLWLERGLHQLFDSVAAEPIPDSLLKIIEQDRGRK